MSFCETAMEISHGNFSWEFLMGIWWPGAGCWVIARGFSVANRLWYLAKQESVSLHCNELALQSWLGDYLRCSLCLCGEKLEIFYVIMVIHGNFRMIPFYISGIGCLRMIEKMFHILSSFPSFSNLSSTVSPFFRHIFLDKKITFSWNTYCFFDWLTAVWYPQIVPVTMNVEFFCVL